MPWACVWCAVGRDDSWKAVRKAVAVSFSLQVCTVRLNRSFFGGGGDGQEWGVVEGAHCAQAGGSQIQRACGMCKL